jgi:electron transfer flavoprotein beta subunit
LLAEKTGARFTAMSVGDKKLDNSKLLKGALSRGPEELHLIIDDSLTDADAYQTAAALAAALQKIGFDIVICGEGSSDLYAKQVGIQLGEQLGVSVFKGVSKITFQGSAVIIERTLEKGTEALEVSLPAVFSVTTDINLPRIPQMKDILAAGKKPAAKWTLADVEAGPERVTEIISTLAPESVARKQIVIEGDSEDNIAVFIQNIRKEL